MTSSQDEKGATTPRPWRVYEIPLVDGDIGIMRDVELWGDGGFGLVWSLTKEADAALIVKAVNEHDALVAIAEEAAALVTRESRWREVTGLDSPTDEKLASLASLVTLWRRTTEGRK